MLGFKGFCSMVAMLTLMQLAPATPGDGQVSQTWPEAVAELRAQIQDIKDDLASMRGEIQAARTLADQANRAVQSVGTTASGAQSTANHALSLGQQAAQAVDATNEKIDRLFRKQP
jgi:methyl-accepting chemotaxis protein